MSEWMKNSWMFMSTVCSLYIYFPFIVYLFNSVFFSLDKIHESKKKDLNENIIV